MEKIDKVLALIGAGYKKDEIDSLINPPKTQPAVFTFLTAEPDLPIIKINKPTKNWKKYWPDDLRDLAVCSICSKSDKMEQKFMLEAKKAGWSKKSSLALLNRIINTAPIGTDYTYGLYVELINEYLANPEKGMQTALKAFEE